MAPRWIAFEGGEGSGKSTQARRLAERLGAELTREPGGTDVGERIRSVLLDPEVAGLDPRAEALLMAADRAQHVAELVRPALASGRSVVSDRSAYSSLAYQGHGRGLGVDAIRTLCDWATDGMWPDVAILLDVPTDERTSRMKDPPDRMEAAGGEFHDLVADGFRALAVGEPDRWLVVDGTGGVDDVERRVAASWSRWEEAHR